MITTATADYRLEEGANAKFVAGTNIVCEPTFYELTDNFAVVVRVLDATTSSEAGQGQVFVTATEVDAETGSGTGETDPWFNALQKAVKTKLSAITGNGSTTFTVV